MRKMEKKIVIRRYHDNREFPLSVFITELTKLEKSKSGYTVPLYTDYIFECTINGIYYNSQSRNDASIAFLHLIQQLEHHGFELKSCGTCLNFYIDQMAIDWYGGLFGFCHRGKNWDDARSINHIRHCLHYCANQISKNQVDYSFYTN